MEIILVQHCQSEHHVNGLTGGWTDTPLTEHGRSQAARVAQRLVGIGVSGDHKLFSSDLLRASQTADIIGNVIGVEVRQTEGLREINNGVAAGRTREWAATRRSPSRMTGLDLDHREFEGGETWREFYGRIHRAMQEITSCESDLVVVTHGCALGFVVSWWLGLSAEMLEHVAFLASPGSVSVLGKSKFGQNALKVFNDVSHLRHD